jgi:hypothetical protein
VSALYIYSIQKNVIEHMSSDDLDHQWLLFDSRVNGKFVGPMLSRGPDENEENFQEFKSKTAPPTGR